MKKETKEIFTSFDGKIFAKEDECKKYERGERRVVENQIQYFRGELKTSNSYLQHIKAKLSKIFTDWLKAKYDLESLLANRTNSTDVDYFKKLSKLSMEYSKLLELKVDNETQVEFYRNLIKAHRLQKEYYMKRLKMIDASEEATKIMENYITLEMAADDNFKNYPEAYDKANIVAADCCGYCEYYNASSGVCGFHKLYTDPTDVCSEFLKR